MAGFGRLLTMDVIASFIANAEATELMQPRQRARDDPTVDTQSTTLLRMALGQNRFNPALLQRFPVRLRMVRAISLHAPGAFPGPPPLPRNGWNRIDQGEQWRYIVAVRTGELGGERNPLRIGDDVML